MPAQLAPFTPKDPQLSKHCDLALPEKPILQLGKLRSREGWGTASATQPQRTSSTTSQCLTFIRK